MDRAGFAKTLRDARARAGLSQATLAKRSALTAPYISLLESGRRRPPAAGVIERLAKALGPEGQGLAETAALERTPDPIRRRVEGLDRERVRVNRARDRILTTALYRLARTPTLLAASYEESEEGEGSFHRLLAKLSSRLRGFRSAHEARAKSAELLERVPTAERERLIDALPDVLVRGAPAGPDPGEPPTVERVPAVPVPVRGGLAPDAVAEEDVWLDGRWARPGCFLWRVGGDEAWPRVEAGDLLLLDPGATPTDGDLVALRHAGVDRVGTWRRRGEEVRLESLRADVPPLRLAAGEARRPAVVLWVLHRAK